MSAFFYQKIKIPTDFCCIFAYRCKFTYVFIKNVVDFIKFICQIKYFYFHFHIFIHRMLIATQEYFNWMYLCTAKPQSVFIRNCVLVLKCIILTAGVRSTSNSVWEPTFSTYHNQWMEKALESFLLTVFIGWNIHICNAQMLVDIDTHS